MHGERGRSIRVVICEDSPELRTLFEIELEAEGDIEVLGATGDGDEAVALTGRLRPDAIVLDLSIGGISGLEAIEPILAASPTTRVIVVSGAVDQETMRQTRERGAFGHLPKSATAAELRDAIRRAAG